MEINKELQKTRGFHTYIITIFLVFTLIIVFLLMLKYSVEGESNLPFNLKEMDVISSANGEFIRNEENLWQTDVYQNNDIYFYLEKNENYKNEEMIKKVTFNNFSITKQSGIGINVIYRPSDEETYNYKEEYIVNDSIEYIGNSEGTDIKNLKINNQGGLIGFSIVTNGIGKYTFNENEKVVVDGTLLNKIGINQNDIQYELSFDIIIETQSNKQFKCNIKINLPQGDIVKDGVSIQKYDDRKDFIFKRVNN